MNAKKLSLFAWISTLALILITACAPAAPALSPAAAPGGDSYASGISSGKSSTSDSGGSPASSAPAAAAPVEAAAPAAAAAHAAVASGPGSFAAPAEPTATAPGYPPQGSTSSILTAGEVDDLLNFPFFQRYAARARSEDQYLPTFRVNDPLILHITGGDEQPISNARVTLTPAGLLGKPFTADAGTDGRLVLFPNYDLNADTTRFVVEVRLPGESMPRYNSSIDLSQLDPGSTLEINLVNAPARLPNALDLMLVIDTTGSMGDELSYLTSEFQGIVSAVRERFPNIDMRFGLVVYRDQGDEYVVRSFDFTSSTEQMQEWLAQQYASGGGDEPEAVPDALQAALNAEWRGGNTARVLLQVADAPAHFEAYTAFLQRVRQLRTSGIHVYPVAASGVNSAAEYLMRHSALLTQGRYLFLTDDSGVGNAHAEPKIPCYVVTHLDDLIERVVLSELSGSRVEPQEEEIIRYNGNYQNGVCLED